ncbi:MAG: universal stress protein [Bacteroidota bacterium]
MVRRVLVALDSDRDTTVATRYAGDLVRPCDGTVTGLALVAKDAIDSVTAGGGIGSMYYAEKRRQELSEQVLGEAKTLLDQFAAHCEDQGIRFERAEVAVGVPHEQITEHLRYHDLLVAGDESHFFYAKPDKRTHALARIAQAGAGAVLIVEKTYRAVERVLIAFDGDTTSARTLQKFAHLAPFGTDLPIDLVCVVGDESEEKRLVARDYLSRAASYLEAYGFSDLTHHTPVGGSALQTILSHAEHSEADAIVAGAYSRSGISRLFFGSTAKGLIESSPVPLFMYH